MYNIRFRHINNCYANADFRCFCLVCLRWSGTIQVRNRRLTPTKWPLSVGTSGARVKLKSGRGSAWSSPPCHPLTSTDVTSSKSHMFQRQLVLNHSFAPIFFFGWIIEDGFWLDTTIQYKGRIHSVQPSQVIIGQTSYRFQLKVHPSGPAFTLPVKMEVVIGTQPLKTSMNNFVYSGSGISLNSPSLQTHERKNTRKIRWSSSSITFYNEKNSKN